MLSMNGLSQHCEWLYELYTYIGDKLDKENGDYVLIGKLKNNISDELKNSRLSNLSKYLLRSALEHNKTPLEKIVDSFDPNEDQNRALLQVGINIQEYDRLYQNERIVQQLKDDLDKSGADKSKAVDAFRYASKELHDRNLELEMLLA